MPKKQVSKSNDDKHFFRTTENSHSDEPLVLSPDDKAASLSSIKDAYQALSFLYEMIQKDQCTIGTRHNCMYIARSHMQQLVKFLNHEDDIKQEAELYSQSLRNANKEISRLRDEMGKGVTVDAIGSKLHLMDRTIYNWWKNLGFTYSKSSISASHRGGTFKVEFTVSVERHISSFENKPVTAQAMVDNRREMLAKELDIVYHSKEPYVLDNPKNRQWITKKLEERFPGCIVLKWESMSIYRSDDFQIRHVEVFIDFDQVGGFEEMEVPDLT